MANGKRDSRMSVAGKAALSILERMHRLAREGLWWIPPNAVIFYLLVMSCLSFSDDSNRGSWAEKVLSDFEQCDSGMKGDDIKTGQIETGPKCPYVVGNHIRCKKCFMCIFSNQNFMLYRSINSDIASAVSNPP
jgi:hypothetical protein